MKERMHAKSLISVMVQSREASTFGRSFRLTFASLSVAEIYWARRPCTSTVGQGLDAYSMWLMIVKTDLAPYIEWKVKMDDRVVWWGTPSAAYHLDLFDWRSAPRDRLDCFLNRDVTRESSLLVDRTATGGRVRSETYNLSEPKARYTDVGVVADVSTLSTVRPNKLAALQKIGWMVSFLIAASLTSVWSWFREMGLSTKRLPAIRELSRPSKRL
jgi:hypothetical protein